MKLIPLHELAKTTSGGTPSRGNKVFYGGEIPWLKSGELPDGEIHSSEEFITPSALESSSAKLLSTGTLLIAMYGATVGKLGILNFPAATNQAVCAITPNERLDRDYLFHWLLSVRSQLVDTSFGGAQPNISQTVIRNLAVPWVPVPRQRQIATRLKSQLAEVETARQAAQAQVREADALRAAIYRDAFRHVVPVAVPPDLAAPPAGWRWHKLTDLARLESGHTPSRSRPDWWGGDVSWISLTEIRALDGQWVESTQLRTNEQGIAHSAARILPRGTVCYSRTASVGFVAIMAVPMATSQDFANWVCGDALDPAYLMHALIRARAQLRELATGATHKTIYMPTLASFHLCAPDLADQRRLVQRLQAQLAEADTVHAAAVAQLAEIERLPQRLLAQAFAPSTPQGDVT